MTVPMLLLDEPLLGLSPMLQQTVAGHMKKHQRKGNEPSSWPSSSQKASSPGHRSGLCHRKWDPGIGVEQEMNWKGIPEGEGLLPRCVRKMARELTKRSMAASSRWPLSRPGKAALVCLGERFTIPLSIGWFWGIASSLHEMGVKEATGLFLYLYNFLRRLRRTWRCTGSTRCPSGAPIYTAYELRYFCQRCGAEPFLHGQQPLLHHGNHARERAKRVVVPTSLTSCPWWKRGVAKGWGWCPRGQFRRTKGSFRSERSWPAAGLFAATFPSTGRGTVGPDAVHGGHDRKIPRESPFHGPPPFTPEIVRRLSETIVGPGEN